MNDLRKLKIWIALNINVHRSRSEIFSNVINARKTSENQCSLFAYEWIQFERTIKRRMLNETNSAWLHLLRILPL